MRVNAGWARIFVLRCIRTWPCLWVIACNHLSLTVGRVREKCVNVRLEAVFLRKNALLHRPPRSLMARPKQGLLRRRVLSLPRATPAGRSACLATRLWSWKSSIRPISTRLAGCSKKPSQAPPQPVLGNSPQTERGFCSGYGGCADGLHAAP